MKSLPEITVISNWKDRQHLFLRDNTIYNLHSYRQLLFGLIALSILHFLLSGCTGPERTSSERVTPETGTFEHYFTLPQSVAPSHPIYSVELYPSGRPNEAPFLELNSSDRLTLRFESLGFDSRSYEISFTHHNPDWSESGLSPDQFFTGFGRHDIPGGIVSRTSQPYYRSYPYHFPNQNVGFRVSGNYILHVHNRDTGDLEFSLPFFVYENEGTLASSAELLRSPRYQHRVMHRPISRYLLPAMVEQPQFDLSFFYSQNQFWGRALEARELDFSDPNEVRFELSHNRLFHGDYEFRVLNLNNVDQLSRTVLDIDKGSKPWKITLRDDAQGFTRPITAGIPSKFGPQHSMNSNYLDVEFSFDAETYLNGDQRIYLAGDFNSWKLSPEYQMELNEQTGRWTHSVILKEGTYRYKYVLADNNRIDDLAFDTLFPDTRQQYHAFVYFRDTQQFYHRLLQVNTFYKESR